jgi:hypothetical protein
MNVVDNFSHEVLNVFATFARIMLSILEGVENALRVAMKGAGLSTDAQTLLLLLIIITFLVGISRFLRGRVRTVLALLLILVLAHSLEHIAHGSLG